MVMDHDDEKGQVVAGKVGEDDDDDMEANDEIEEMDIYDEIVIEVY